MFFLKKKRWWPAYAGLAFAVVELLSFVLSERPLGVTRGFTVIGSILEYLFFQEHSYEVAYWEIYSPFIDYSMALIVGLVVGSFISSKSSGDFKLNLVPESWKTSRGPSVWKRWVWAFIGGVMIGFAARISGGCISGMLISGSVQLAPGGYIFMLAVWIGGFITTALFYRGKGYTLSR